MCRKPLTGHGVCLLQSVSEGAQDNGCSNDFRFAEGSVCFLSNPTVIKKIAILPEVRSLIGRWLDAHEKMRQLFAFIDKTANIL